MASGSVVPRSFRGIVAGGALALATTLVLGPSVAGAQQAYAGVQSRTPVDQIPAGGQMRNFTLVGQNAFVDPVMGIPRGMNGGIAAAGECAYVGSNIGMQPDLVIDMADPT